MNTEEVLKTAHIHLDHAVFRVHVADTDKYDIEAMNESESKPDFVLWISRSADPSENKVSLIISVVNGFSLVKMADWIKSFEN